MKYLDAAQTADLLAYDQVAAALDDMLKKISAGTAHAPVRQIVDLGNGGVLLLMPARDENHASVKVITVHAKNAQHHLPAIQGELLLMNAHTGERLLLLDGPTVTSRRTAAVSLLGARKLAPNRRDSMLLIGSGVQARAHIDAFVRHWGIRHLQIFSNAGEQADELARYACEKYEISAGRVNSPADATETAGLIVTATSSLTPVLHGPVAPDCMIIAMGAYRPDMAEIAPRLVHQCDVYVDTLEGAKEEAGDLLQADVTWSTVTPLHAIAERRQPNGRPVLFKTVGDALWDLAAAELAYKLLSDRVA